MAPFARDQGRRYLKFHLAAYILVPGPVVGKSGGGEVFCGEDLAGEEGYVLGEVATWCPIRHHLPDLARFAVSRPFATSKDVAVLAEVTEALGPDPERGVLDAVLLFLIAEDRMSVARAGEIMGLEDRSAAARWHASRGSFRIDPVGDNRAEGETQAAITRSRARPYEPVGLSPGAADVLPPGRGVADQFLQDKRERDF